MQNLFMLSFVWSSFNLIIEVIDILTGSPSHRKYWNALKTKLKAERSESSHKLGQLKMQSSDGKFYLTVSGHAIGTAGFQ
jgi:predicted signal transduction protein with EAL and GGDEF domain